MPNALEQKQKDAKRPALPPRLVLGLIVAILLDTASQTLWKQAALNLPDDALSNIGGMLGVVLHQPLFLLVGFLFIGQMVNWLHVLSDADVSYALPVTALSYVSVAAVSAVWLHEAITTERIIGMALILAGVILISRTDHNTLNPPGPL
jgi:drug/metabolite transporter (DMT)-like permease